MENFTGPGPARVAELEDGLTQSDVEEVTSGDFDEVKPLHEELGLPREDVDEVDAETLRNEPPYYESNDE